MFSQKRADYYAPAIIILLYGIQFRLKYKPLLLKSFILLLGFQVALFLVLSGLSISQSIYASMDFNSAMKHQAYGYAITKEIESIAGIHAYSNLVTRNTRLYSNTNYVDKDKFSKCVTNNENLINKYSYCARLLSVKFIAATLDSNIDDEPQILCETKSTNLASRNFFNKRQISYKMCEYEGK